MALVVCADCEGTVSSEAKACVHCGKPFVEEQNDAAKMLLTIPYAVYLLGSGFMVGLGVMDVYVRFASRQGLPTHDEIIVFLLWFLSICAGWLALTTIGKGPKVFRKGVVKDATSVALDHHIEQRNRASA